MEAADQARAEKMTKRQTRDEREGELRRQLLDDPRLGALIGTMHHCLGYSPREIVGLFGGLSTTLVSQYLNEFVTHHQQLLQLPAGMLAVELRRRNIRPTTAA